MQTVERQLKVALTEPLGNETLVFVNFASHDWIARMLNPSHLEEGATISVTFDLAKAHLFSIADGRAITAGA